MRALLWKELRENIGWALLAMLALGSAEIYALHHTQYPGQFDPYFADGITLCKKPFLMVTRFGCAAAALALGFLQVLPELKRDRWAALLHRPMSRGRLFWGKAMAGVLLYGLAAGVPFLTAVWHVATPGNFGTPFVPAMVRPGLADVAAGLTYYFAALLVALQGGTLLRAIPILAAIHVSFVVIDEDLFRVALEAAAAMSFVLCLAGWGAIHARDSLRDRPWLASLAFLVTVFYGACGLGDLARKAGSMAGRIDAHPYGGWEVLDNGVPARLDYVNSVLVSTTGPDGQPFTDPKYRPDRVRSYTLGTNTAGNYIGDSHGFRVRRDDDSYRESATYLYSLSPYDHPRFEQWFYLRREHQYVGMLPAEKKAFARLGTNGFAPPEARVPGFADDVRSDLIGGDILLIAAPDSLRLALLARREIVPVALPAPGPIYGTCHTWATTPTGVVNFQGVALGTGMAVYKADGQVAAMLPYHYDVDRWGRISLGVLKTMDRFVLQYEPSQWIDRKIQQAMPRYVETLDAQGNVLAAYTLQPPPPYVESRTWVGIIAPRLQSPAFFFGEMLYRRAGAALGSDRLREALDKQLGRNFNDTFHFGCAIVIVALVLAAITFFWARRAQLPLRRAWAWAVAVLVLGLPGFILFWLAGERPRTVPCPACHRLRRIEGEKCAHCEAAWPPHPADDTAILDRSTHSPVVASA
jgi:hypothetical protein